MFPVWECPFQTSAGVEQSVTAIPCIAAVMLVSETTPDFKCCLTSSTRCDACVFVLCHVSASTCPAPPRSVICPVCHCILLAYCKGVHASSTRPGAVSIYTVRQAYTNAAPTTDTVQSTETIAVRYTHVSQACMRQAAHVRGMLHGHAAACHSSRSQVRARVPS